MNYQYIKQCLSVVSLHVMAILLFVAVHNASAQVVVEQYTSLGAGVNNASFSFDTVSASDSVLFVAIGSEVHSFTSVTFDGVTLTSPVESNDVGSRESLIFSFDLGNETATSGQSIDIVANNTLGGSSQYNAWALQVSNADFSSLGSDSSNGGDITVPSLTAGSLVLDVIGSQNGVTLTPSGLARTYWEQQNVSSANHGSSYITNTTGGGAIGWTGENDGSNSGIWIEEKPAGASVTLDGSQTSDSVSENVAIGTIVGVLDTVVTDSWTPPISFAFNGGTDDASFSIADSTNLVTTEVFDRETKSSYTIDIRATDSAGTPNTTNTEFTITIDDVSEPGGSMYAVGEVAVASTLAGTFQTLLASGDSSVTYGVTAGTYHGDLFEISGASSDELHLKAAATAAQLNHEYFVEVTASGDSTGAYDPMLLKITVVSNVSTGSVFRFR